MRYSVSYDELPPTDGSVWKGSCHGIPVIVRKRDQALLAGLEIDFVGGEFTFNESSSNIKV